jgi:hypothetical protein
LDNVERSGKCDLQSPSEVLQQWKGGEGASLVVGKSICFIHRSSEWYTRAAEHPRVVV